jgi:hypothetical protein
MKRLIASLAAVVLGVVTLGGAASAVTPQGASTHYTSTFSNFYVDYGVAWNGTCSGNRIVNNGGGTKDVETCTITGDTSTIVAGTYKSTGIAPPSLGYCVGYAVGSIPFIFENAPACWASDYDGQFASSWKLSFAPGGGSPGAWTEDIVAYYNT